MKIFRGSKKTIFSIFAINMLTHTNHAFSDENINISDRYKLNYGLTLRGNLRTATNNFYINNIPNQNLDNQTSSATAYSTDFFSAKLGFEIKDLGSFHSRLDYLWQNTFKYNLYINNYNTNEFLLRDFFLKIPFQQNEFSLWIGKRTIEFENIYLFQMANPFDQVDLQGIGIESNIFQAAISINKSTVFTTGKDSNGNIILDNSNNPILYPEKDYIFTAFLAGKFLLAEGKIFQPILTLRAYESISNGDKEGVIKNKVTRDSAFIVGGIFYRPLSENLKGTTTIWFESLPESRPQNNLNTLSPYYGEGRIPSKYSKNTIGIADSSEYLINNFFGLLSGIVILNNTYASNLNLLRISDDKNSLVPDQNTSVKTTNRISIDLQPVFYLSSNFHLGIDTNFNYVSKKLIANDANSFIISPILKYVFDEKLKTNKYFFISMSYGVYDWNVKILPNGSHTNKLFTTQTGINLSF